MDITSNKTPATRFVHPTSGKSVVINTQPEGSSMLAEQTLSISSKLPKTLRDKAQILAGELAWTGLEAKKTVSWLAQNGNAVVGVELWRNQEGHPLWLATSDYASSIHDMSMTERISWCALKAKEFIQAHHSEPGALFNLTWEDHSH